MTSNCFFGGQLTDRTYMILCSIHIEPKTAAPAAATVSADLCNDLMNGQYRGFWVSLSQRGRREKKEGRKAEKPSYMVPHARLESRATYDDILPSPGET